MTNCREFASWVDTFVDGELPVERAVEAECHVASCHCCAERVRFERAMRTSIKRAVHTASAATASLEERMKLVLVAERMKQPSHACSPVQPPAPVTDIQVGIRPPISEHQLWEPPRQVQKQAEMHSVQPRSTTMRWRTLLPLAAVAAGAILYAGYENEPKIQQSWNHAKSGDLKLSELDSYLDQMVSRHQAAKNPSRPLQIASVEALEPPFQLPPIQEEGTTGFTDQLQPHNKALPGFRGTSAAYQVRGHRVTFFAYEPSSAPLRARLEGHSLRGHVVYVGRRQGYSVATVEDGPVGFAMTSDLPPLESADLIASAVEAHEHR